VEMRTTASASTLYLLLFEVDGLLVGARPSLSIAGVISIEGEGVEVKEALEMGSSILTFSSQWDTAASNIAEHLIRMEVFHADDNDDGNRDNDDK
jgi:hypothetical protein